MELLVSLVEDTMRGVKNPKRVILLLEAEDFSPKYQLKIYHAWLLSVYQWAETSPLLTTISEATEADEKLIRKGIQIKCKEVFGRIDGGWNPFLVKGDRTRKATPRKCPRCSNTVIARPKKHGHAECPLCRTSLY